MSQTQTTNGTSLVARLAEACDAVGGLAKKGRNKDQGYDYLKAADVAKAMRHELFKRGILVIPHETSLEQERFQNATGKYVTEAKMCVTYRVTNGQETLEFNAYGVARDFSDKAIYKAKTGALKYFLRGLGLIPDESDDPETSHIEATGNGEKNLQDLEDRMSAQARINPAQVKAIWEACSRSNKSNEQLAEYLKTLNGYVQLEEVQKQHFQDVLKWANTKGNYSETALKASVEQAQFKKLFALAKKHNVSDADMHQYIKETWGHASMKELTQDQFRQLGEWLESVPV